MQRYSSLAPCKHLHSYSSEHAFTSFLRYNEDLELEDAVHTAILTLKVSDELCMYIGNGAGTEEDVCRSVNGITLW